MMSTAQKNLAPTQREYWVDFLKGINIILVVLGHAGVSDTLAKAIYLFHMPLFFLISGYLDNSHDEPKLWNVFKRKAPRLLWPYFTYGVIVIIWKTVWFLGVEGNFTTLLLKRVVAFVYGNYIWENNYDYIGTLWFLVGLFSVICISNLLHRITSEKIRMVVTIAVVMFGSILSNLLLQWKIRLPWCLDVALIAVFFYELGLWWKQKRKYTGYKSFLVAVLLLITGAALGIWNMLQFTPKVDMLLMNFGCFPIFLISASLISLGIMIAISNVYSMRFKLMEYIGRQSLTVMIAHIYISQVVAYVGMSFIPVVTNVWVCFLLTTALSVLASFIVEKILPFLNDFKYVRRVKYK